MKHLRIGSTLCALVLIGAADAEDRVPPPPAGVEVQQVAGARIVEAVFPGAALDTAITSAGVAVLVAGEDDPDGARAIYGIDPAGDGSLIELARDLPPEVDSVAVLGGLLLAGEPGRIYALGTLEEPATSRPARVLLEAPDLDLDVLSSRGWITAGRAYVPHPRLSRLDVHHWNGGPPAAAAVETLTGVVHLPVRARRVRTGLVLSTPRIRLLDRDDGPPLLAIGPEAQGKRRLLTTLIDPSAPDPVPRDGDDGDDGGTPGEAWVRFAANERVDQSWYLDVDGRWMLAVAALSADKLGIFEKKKLRVFPLRTDRTRAGSAPALAIDTATRNWYSLGVHVTDFDRDGRDDLAVVQPDGLGAKKLVVEVYRGKGTGGFFLTPRRSVVVAPDADWVYGKDVDGDRIPDLVAVADGGLLVFRGSTRKKLVIEKTPRWSFDAADLGAVADRVVEIQVGGDSGGSDEDSGSDSGSDEDSGSDSDAPSLGRPRVVDLDGDGRNEILLQGKIRGRTVLRVLFLK